MGLGSNLSDTQVNRQAKDKALMQLQMGEEAACRQQELGSTKMRNAEVATLDWKSNCEGRWHHVIGLETMEEGRKNHRIGKESGRVPAS